MIYRMMRDIEAELQRRKFPLVFTYEPANPRQTYAHRGLVAVERDTEKGEQINPPLGSQSNARRVGVRLIGVKWTVYAQSGVDGALRNDHEHECDRYIDAIQCAIYAWGKASGAGVIEFDEARYLSAAERDGSDLAPDVAYVLRFRVPRGVILKDYEGAAQPTAAPAVAEASTLARTPGSQYEDVP